MSPDPTPPNPSPRVLVAVQDPAVREHVVELLRRQGMQVQVAASGADLGAAADQGDSDVVVLSRSKLTREQLEALELRDDADAPGVIVLDPTSSPMERTQLIASGATAVLDPDPTNRNLEGDLTLFAGAEAAGGIDGPDLRGAEVEAALADFHSRSPRMREFLELVHRVVQSDTSLLICGETGVGKERLAHAIHNESGRRQGPFVAVNCGALPENLLESELFGHEKGAFTGAGERRTGRFEQANGGTILLDEIGEMPLHLQVNLLSVLQQRQVCRLGGSEPIDVDVRVIAATNRDLQDDVRAGRFREDLLYRLNVIYLEIPPLRERPEDLPDLIGRFLSHLRHEVGREDLTGLTDTALQALLDHPWPGNVRELLNVLERAVLLARGSRITFQDLPPSIQGRGAPTDAGADETPPTSDLAAPFLDLTLQKAKQRLLADFEVAYLRGLLTRCQGHVGDTARAAGINPRTLYEKMRRYGLRKEDFKDG